MRSDVIFSTSLIVKTLSAIWVCSFLRAALNLIAHYRCFVYATYWSLCYQILIVDYFNTLRLSLSFNARKNTSRSKGFSVSVMLQSLPATRHKQTPDFVVIKGGLHREVAMNRLRRDVRLCFSAFIVSRTFCVLGGCLFFYFSFTAFLNKIGTGTEKKNTFKY